jgi:hypothetical protein
MLAAVLILFEIQQEKEEEVKWKEEEDVLSLPNLTVNTAPWW